MHKSEAIEKNNSGNGSPIVAIVITNRIRFQ